MVKSIFERNKTREEKITKQNDMGNDSFYYFLIWCLQNEQYAYMHRWKFQIGLKTKPRLCIGIWQILMFRDRRTDGGEHSQLEIAEGHDQETD